jgi:gentisate 1,2-dioxygenase
MGLTLNISDYERGMVLQCLNIVRDACVERRTDDGVVEAITHVMHLVEMEEELDSKEAALLYSSLEVAIPGVVKEGHRHALTRVRDTLRRDGEILMKQARKAFH